MSLLLNCETCMQTMGPTERRRAGCGFELPLEGAMPWRPGEGYTGPAPTVCIGYLKSLPEVQEVVAAFPHWDRGALRDFVDDAPSRPLLLGLQTLNHEIRAIESHLMRPKDGGR